MVDLAKLTTEQLTGAITDLLTAVNQRFTNPSQDLVVVEDIVALAAAVGVPGAVEGEVALTILTILGAVIFPFWIPPWSPGYAPPNSNHDVLARPGR